MWSSVSDSNLVVLDSQGQTIANHHLPGRVRYKGLGQGRNSTQRDTWRHREKDSSAIQIYADSTRPVKNKKKCVGLSPVITVICLFFFLVEFFIWFVCEFLVVPVSFGHQNAAIKSSTLTATTWPFSSWAARSAFATTSYPSAYHRRAKITKEPSALWLDGEKRIHRSVRVAFATVCDLFFHILI
jgi:hypothetical protein